MQLRRVLSQRWVEKWEEWKCQAEYLEDDNRDDDVDQEYAAECVMDLSRRTLQDIQIDAATDMTRRDELHRAGRRIGQGHSCGRLNASLPDSILQLLSFHNLVPTELQTDAQQRQQACDRCRTYMMDAEARPELCPRLRDDVGQPIICANDEEHDYGQLDYLIHGEAIVRFFLEHFDAPRPVNARSVRIIVYTRIDSEEFNPLAAAHTSWQREGEATDDAARGPLALELYGNTGKAVCGREYDPVIQW